MLVMHHFVTFPSRQRAQTIEAVLLRAEPDGPPAIFQQGISTARKHARTLRQRPVRRKIKLLPVRHTDTHDAALRTDPQTSLAVLEKRTHVHILLQGMKREERRQEGNLLQPRPRGIPQIALTIKGAVTDEGDIG